MKWFKHFTDSMDDLFIKDLERRFGHAGYVFWFKTLELIGKHGDHGKVIITWANYRTKLGCEKANIQRMLVFSASNSRLSFEATKADVKITCEKFAELTDNYTKYNGVSSKRLQRQLEVSSKQEVEGEAEEEQKEKEKENSNHTPKPRDLLEVIDYALTMELDKSDAEAFFDYYCTNGWKVGKNSMKDWHAALRNWKRRKADHEPHHHRNQRNLFPTAAPGSQQARATYSEAPDRAQRLRDSLREPIF
jgi:hypothetical protein